MTQVFHAGGVDVRPFSDGLLKTSIDFVIGMERSQADALVGGTSDGSLDIPVNSFLFRTSGATVLIDVGAGNTMQSSLGKLAGNLVAAGVAPADVTHILLTHLHPDHANGLVDDAGHAVYPNAEILVHEREFDFWAGEGGSAEPDNVKRQRARNRISLRPYLDRVRRMRDGDTVVNCSPMLAPGHSPGHTCWRIGTGQDAFIAWGDLVHFAKIQISHPDTAVKYDLDPDLARQSRLRMLDILANERLAVAAAHVGAPGFGFLARKGPGYVFEPA